MGVDALVSYVATCIKKEGPCMHNINMHRNVFTGVFTGAARRKKKDFEAGEAPTAI